MRRGTFVLVLLGLVGCARGDRDFITGDESFTADERAAIEQGRAFIAAATGKPVPEIIWGPLPDSSDDDAMKITRAPLRQHELGNTSEGRFRIWLSPSQRPDRVAETTAHEMGHALGLEHIAEPGLMNPLVSEKLQWSANDQAACEAYGVCTR